MDTIYSFSMRKTSIQSFVQNCFQYWYIWLRLCCAVLCCWYSQKAIKRHLIGIDVASVFTIIKYQLIQVDPRNLGKHFKAKTHKCEFVRSLARSLTHKSTAISYGRIPQNSHIQTVNSTLSCMVNIKCKSFQKLLPFFAIFYSRLIEARFPTKNQSIFPNGKVCMCMCGSLIQCVSFAWPHHHYAYELNFDLTSICCITQPTSKLNYDHKCYISLLYV